MDLRNRPEEIEERRCRDILLIVGRGSVIFSLWSLIKAVGMIILRRGEYTPTLIEVVEQVGEQWHDNYFYFLVIAAFVALCVEFLIRAIAGFAAISEGRGGRRTPLYIVLTFILIWNSFTIIVDVITGNEASRLDIRGGGSTWSYVIIEATSMILMIEMAAAAIRLRRLRRKEKRRRAKNAA